MTKLPNWVDLVVITIFIRTCYNGFGRGALIELLNLAGVVAVTALTFNFWGRVASALRVLPLEPYLTAQIAFWGTLCLLAIAMHMALRLVGGFAKWERLHWAVQGIGLVAGGIRGLWWAGLFVVVLVGSGLPLFRQGVEERSVLGPALVKLSQTSFVRVADVLPGAGGRGRSLVPPMRPASRSQHEAATYARLPQVSLQVAQTAP